MKDFAVRRNLTRQFGRQCVLQRKRQSQWLVTANSKRPMGIIAEVSVGESAFHIARVNRRHRVIVVLPDCTVLSTSLRH